MAYVTTADRDSRASTLRAKLFRDAVRTGDESVGRSALSALASAGDDEAARAILDAFRDAKIDEERKRRWLFAVRGKPSSVARTVVKAVAHSAPRWRCATNEAAIAASTGTRTADDADRGRTKGTALESPREWDSSCSP